MTAAELFTEYADWLRGNVPPAHANLAPPATARELDALEGVIGRALPADVRAVLSVHNGQRTTMTAGRRGYAMPCLPTLSFLSAELIGEAWREWQQVRSSPDLAALQALGDVLPGAEGRVKPLYTSPGWIPLWSDPVRMDHIGLDLDPDGGGTSGQIINFGREEQSHFRCAADFAGLLRILLEEVRSGAWPLSEIAQGPLRQPWFGDPEDHLFNALYVRSAGSAPAGP